MTITLDLLCHKIVLLLLINLTFKTKKAPEGAL